MKKISWANNHILHVFYISTISMWVQPKLGWGYTYTVQRYVSLQIECWQFNAEHNELSWTAMCGFVTQRNVLNTDIIWSTWDCVSDRGIPIVDLLLIAAFYLRNCYGKYGTRTEWLRSHYWTFTDRLYCLCHIYKRHPPTFPPVQSGIPSSQCIAEPHMCDPRYIMV